MTHVRMTLAEFWTDMGPCGARKLRSGGPDAAVSVCPQKVDSDAH